jgi:tRNA pseudouridine38-40 synthase
MYRYFLHLAYKGTHYHGWQYQPNAVSVQEVMEEKLSMLLRLKIAVIGCGRTDTGVHASDFYLHFDTEIAIENPEKLVFQLNSVLPKDIAIFACLPVVEDAHARFSALTRKYIYYINFIKNPFIQELSYHFKPSIVVARMQEVAPLFLGKKDFTSFSKLHTDVNNNFCEVYELEILPTDKGVEIHISANRFLRNMVRAIVGTLLEVGEGKKDAKQVMEIIEQKNRAYAGPSVPACGLFLHKIIYPKDIFI